MSLTSLVKKISPKNIPDPSPLNLHCGEGTEQNLHQILYGGKRPRQNLQIIQSTSLTSNTSGYTPPRGLCVWKLHVYGWSQWLHKAPKNTEEYTGRRKKWYIYIHIHTNIYIHTEWMIMSKYMSVGRDILVDQNYSLSGRARISRAYAAVWYRHI